MTGGTTARGAARSVADSRGLEVLVRVGFGASALVHVILGVLAIRIALHGGGESDQSGALEQVAKLPAGDALLWAAVVGMSALALWLVVQALLGIGSSSKKRWARSLVSVGKATAYGSLAATALAVVQGRASSSTSSTRRASSTVLSLPGGQVLLALIGLVAIGIGGYLVVKGVRRGFTKDITVPGEPWRTPVLVLGTVGYAAKGVAVAVVGVLFAVAAITVDPQRASGLDGALRALTALPFGQVLLVAVGAGLIAFGLYTVVRARWAHV